MIVFDLDNCLSRDRWRRPLIDWSQQDVRRRYHAYHEQSIRDDAEPFTNADVDMVMRHCGFFILTSRPERYAGITRKWWVNHFMHAPIEFVHRPDWDFSPCHEFKTRTLRALATKYRIPVREWICFDDRPDVVDAYRGMGAIAHVRALDDLKGYIP